jgi:CHAT domain
MHNWLEDDNALASAAELVHRVLTMGTPVTDEELSRVGLPSEPVAAGRFPAAFGWVASAYEREQEFAFPQDKWQDVFRSAGWDEVVHIAEVTGGIVAYHVFDGSTLRLVGIINNGGDPIVRTLPDAAPSRQTSGADYANRLSRVIGGFWAETLTRWRNHQPVGSPLRALCVDIGETPLITYLSDEAFREALHNLELARDAPIGGLTHLPSIRLAAARAANPPPSPTRRLLHIGDATNTLIGPWLEAATLADLPGIEVRSLLDTDMTAAEFRQHLGWAPVIVASCHGLLDATDLLGSALGLGMQSLRLEDVAVSDLTSVDMLFLAACEMGLGYANSHEREALSFANASLIGGSRYTVAPALPVNDFVSAILVTEFAAQARTTSPPLAYNTALEAVRRLTKTQFTERILHMWETLRISALAQRLPWPAAALDPVIKDRIEMAADRQLWRHVAFALSGA